MWSACGASGLCIGSLLGGLLTDGFGWPSVFFVNVPLAAAAAGAALVLIPRDAIRERGRAFDLPGALSVTAGVTLLVFALVQGPESGWTALEVLVRQTGLAFLVPAVLIAVGTQISGRLAGRVDMRVLLVLGMAVGIAGTVLLAVGMAGDGSYVSLLPGIALYGLGQGTTWTGMWIAAASGVAPGNRGWHRR